MAHTAPPGYESNHQALMELIRFAPAIWPDDEFKALLFHAERSTAYGKNADQHSEKQALEGVYSTHQLAWVRGPAGLSHRSWYRANKKLTAGEKPVVTKRGTGGRGNITEYEIDWKEVKARIQEWKEGCQSGTLSQQEGCQSGIQKGANLAPNPQDCGAENKGSDKKKGCQSGTRQSTLTLKSDLDSRSEGIPTRASIDLELEIACGERTRTGGPSTKIVAAATKLNLPLEAVARFIHEKAGDFRARHYPFHAGLIASSFTQEAIKWIRQNRDFVAQCQTRAELAKQKEGLLKQMPYDVPPQAELRPDPEFTRDLMNDLHQRRKLKGA